MSEGSRHFEEDIAVFKALYNIAARLKALDIPHAVIGGMALFRHGLRRFTEDVDVLVTKDDLKTIHENLSGLGYRSSALSNRLLRPEKPSKSAKPNGKVGTLSFRLEKNRPDSSTSVSNTF